MTEGMDAGTTEARGGVIEDVILAWNLVWEADWS
jgi:hypothetical protein